MTDLKFPHIEWEGSYPRAGDGPDLEAALGPATVALVREVLGPLFVEHVTLICPDDTYLDARRQVVHLEGRGRIDGWLVERDPDHQRRGRPNPAYPVIYLG